MRCYIMLTLGVKMNRKGSRRGRKRGSANQFAVSVLPSDEILVSNSTVEVSISNHQEPINIVEVPTSNHSEEIRISNHSEEVLLSDDIEEVFTLDHSGRVPMSDSTEYVSASNQEEIMPSIDMLQIEQEEIICVRELPQTNVNNIGNAGRSFVPRNFIDLTVDEDDNSIDDASRSVDDSVIFMGEHKQSSAACVSDINNPAHFVGAHVTINDAESQTIPEAFPSSATLGSLAHEISASSNNETNDSTPLIYDVQTPSVSGITVHNGALQHSVQSASPFNKMRKIECGVCFDGPNDIKNSKRKLVSTVCGHIFCSECVQMAIRNYHQCPTCRKKLTIKSYHPIYV